MQNNIASALVSFAQNTFRPIVAALIKFRYITLSVFVGLFILSMGLLKSGVAPVAFLPEVEGDMIAFSARFPEGTTFDRKEQVRQQVDAGIDKLNANGKADFGIDEPIITHPGTITDSRQVQGFLGLIDGNKRRTVSTKSIGEKLEEYVGLSLMLTV